MTINRKKPLLSIIIENTRNIKATLDCLKSVFKYTKEYPYELIILDNKNSFVNYQKLNHYLNNSYREYPLCTNYQLTRLQAKRFKGEINNLAAEMATGEFLFFLDNQLTVTANWTTPLINFFNQNQNAGSIGPQIIDKHPTENRRYNDPTTEEEYINIEALLIRKPVFISLGGFNFIYEPDYYADKDLGYKIKSINLKNYHIPNSILLKKAKKLNFTSLFPCFTPKDLQKINHEKFTKRWLKHDFVSSKVIETNKQNPSPKSNLTAGIFTPYNLTPGGGEKYILTTAETLLELGYQVFLIFKEKFSYLRVHAIANIFKLNLQNLTILNLNEALNMPPFTVFISMGNEIIPRVQGFGKNNIFMCQFPFRPKLHLLKVKLRQKNLEKYEHIVVNSAFTKENVKKQLKQYNLPALNLEIIHPPVDILDYHDNTERQGIISVGRFFTGGHAKRQDLLIKAFAKLFAEGYKISLHLVGSLHPEKKNLRYFLKCQQLAKDLPIYFYSDASKEMLTELYNQCSFYWHGAGLQINPRKHPEKCEHFGISVVEAMSAGIIPVVVNNGGPKEIIKNNVNGFHYSTINDLIAKTKILLNARESTLKPLRQAAHLRSLSFSKNSFKEQWKNLLNKLS